MAIAVQVDSIPALRAFVAAAEARSFKIAGEALGVSSSAIGKSIARLEAQLAAALFHRTTRTVTLTDEGALYLDRARRVLNELATAEDELAHATSEPRGRLRVSLPLSGAVLTSVMARFLARHPAIEPDIDYSDRLVDIVDEGFDAVIRSGEQTDSRLMHRRLLSFPWRLVAAPGYLERAGVPRTVADLARHVCLRQKLPTGRLAPWPIRDAGATEPPASLTANIIDPLIEMTLAGAGIAALPDFLVREHLASGALVTVLEKETERTGTLSVLWAANRFRTPKVRAFVDFLHEWSRGENYGG
ncbi:HTH-type transcriptional regulator DmlR [Methylorubrum aminovorans]|nr:MULTISPECIES: LysR substrate-binding domain-containing protein [unclassified Methylobacterium]